MMTRSFGVGLRRRRKRTGFEAESADEGLTQEAVHFFDENFFLKLQLLSSRRVGNKDMQDPLSKALQA